MSKEKEATPPQGEDLDLFEGAEIDDVDLEIVDLEQDEVVKEVVQTEPVKKAKHKLKVKKRLDAYLERKWFKDHGWDDDDDLFNDDFFSESETPDHSRL
jgi:hypothetical protein